MVDYISVIMKHLQNIPKEIVYKTMISLLLFILFFIYYGTMLHDIPFRYYDESLWVGKSYFFDLFLHDRSNPLWDSVYSYDQPKLAEYMFGAITYPDYLLQKKGKPLYSYISYLGDNHLLCIECGNKDSMPITEFTSQRIFDEKINLPGYEHTRSIILNVRMLNRAVAAATVVVIFILGFALWGYVGGTVLAFLYGCDPIIVTSVLVAHADALFLLFYTLSLYLLFLLIQKHTYKYAVYFGLAAGLTSSVKIVGFVLVFIYFIFTWITLYVAKSTKNKIHFGKEFIMCVLIFLGLFVAINPYLHKDTFNRMYSMYQHRLTQQITFEQWDIQNSLSNPIERAQSIIKRFFTHSQYDLGSLLLFLTGMYAICCHIYFHNRHLLQRSFLFFCGYLVFLTMLIWLTVNWERYYTPLVVFVLGVEVEGILAISKQVRYYFTR
jgi:hypothetical protein